MGSVSWRACCLVAARHFSGGHGSWRRTRDHGNSASQCGNGNSIVGHPPRFDGGVCCEAADLGCRCDRGVLCDISWACPWDRIAIGFQCLCLRGRLCDLDRLAAPVWDRFWAAFQIPLGRCGDSHRRGSDCGSRHLLPLFDSVIEPGSSGFAWEALSAFATLPVLLLLVACGLWAGCCRPLILDISIGALLGGFLVGSSGLFPSPGEALTKAALLGLVGGGVVAIGRTDSFALRCGYFLVCGYVVGLFTPPHLVGGHFALCGVLVVVAPVAIGFYLSMLPDRVVWATARRVMGSWTVAVSLLVFAFSLKQSKAGTNRSPAQENALRAS